MPQQPTPDDEKNKMRFAVLDCEDSVKWDGHAIALSRLLGAHGETWEHHRCWSGELPDLREIESYQGLVITGSHYSTRDEQTLPWIGNLKRWMCVCWGFPKSQDCLMSLFDRTTRDGCSIASTCDVCSTGNYYKHHKCTVRPVYSTQSPIQYTCRLKTRD